MCAERVVENHAARGQPTHGIEQDVANGDGFVCGGLDGFGRGLELRQREHVLELRAARLEVREREFMSMKSGFFNMRGNERGWTALSS